MGFASPRVDSQAFCKLDLCHDMFTALPVQARSNPWSRCPWMSFAGPRMDSQAFCKPDLCHDIFTVLPVQARCG